MLRRVHFEKQHTDVTEPPPMGVDQYLHKQRAVVIVWNFVGKIVITNDNHR